MEMQLAHLNQHHVIVLILRVSFCWPREKEFLQRMFRI